MKRTPLKRTGYLRRKTKLKAMSRKRAKASKVYSQKRKAFLNENPFCEACPEIFPLCFPNLACDVHHKAGRIGANYLDESTWLPVCRDCHNWIHNHPSEARSLGLLQ